MSNFGPTILTRFQFDMMSLVDQWVVRTGRRHVIVDSDDKVMPMVYKLRRHGYRPIFQGMRMLVRGEWKTVAY